MSWGSHRNRVGVRVAARTDPPETPNNTGVWSPEMPVTLSPFLMAENTVGTEPQMNTAGGGS